MTRTLHVHIGPQTKRNQIEETLAAIDAGEEVDPQPSRLAVESLETFHRVFRPTNLALLQAIAEHQPQSIRELARMVGRHPPDVTENINELAKYGLVELQEDGRAKRPTLWYDEIVVEGQISLDSTDLDIAPA